MEGANLYTIHTKTYIQPCFVKHSYLCLSSEMSDITSCDNLNPTENSVFQFSVSGLTGHVFLVWIDLSTLSRFENVFSSINTELENCIIWTKDMVQFTNDSSLAQCYWII